MKSGHGSIVWLASYPKSGNTWVRALLTALIENNSKTPDINNLVGNTEFYVRQSLDDLCGIDSANLSAAQLLPYLRAMWLIAADLADDTIFIKVHDQYRAILNGLAVFPAEASRAVIYIVRHPFDVAASLAAHNDSTFDAAIALMGDSSYALHNSVGRGSEFLPIVIGDWSSHVTNWLDQSEIPVLVVRYEDLQANATECLREIAAAAGIDTSSAVLASTAQNCQFQRLRDAEVKSGFIEKPIGSASFFRLGLVGDGRTSLSLAQQSEIYRRHGPVMERLEYSL
jgi:aryl sulfotransferase